MKDDTTLLSPQGWIVNLATISNVNESSNYDYETYGYVPTSFS